MWSPLPPSPPPPSLPCLPPSLFSFTILFYAFFLVSVVSVCPLLIFSFLIIFFSTVRFSILLSSCLVSVVTYSLYPFSLPFSFLLLLHFLFLLHLLFLQLVSFPATPFCCSLSPTHPPSCSSHPIFFTYLLIPLIHFPRVLKATVWIGMMDLVGVGRVPAADKGRLSQATYFGFSPSVRRAEVWWTAEVKLREWLNGWKGWWWMGNRLEEKRVEEMYQWTGMRERRRKWKRDGKYPIEWEYINEGERK